MLLRRIMSSWQAYQGFWQSNARAFSIGKHAPGKSLPLFILISCILPALLSVPGFGEEPRGAAVSVSEAAADFGSHHALIIGIDNYEIWPKLLFAEKDASEIKDLLVSQYGFSSERIVHLAGVNATRKNIIGELRNFCETLGEKDQLLIYYAGHGQYDPLTRTGFWIPVEGTLYDETSWVAFSRLKCFLTSSEVKVKNIILVTDSCYGGALTRSAPTPGFSIPDVIGYERYVRKLRQLADKRSRQVIASGGFEQVPDQSEFAQALKAALRYNEYPLVDLEYLFYSKIYPNLRSIGQTEPIMTRLSSSPDQLGQFVFILGGVRP
jgi:hypothetical protein